MNAFAAPVRAAAERLLAGVLDALYPPLCWLCREAPASDGLGCDEHALRPCAFDPAAGRCRGCARALPPMMPPGGLCAQCRRSPRGYRRLLAWGPYRSGVPLREWILALKHGGRRELALPLGALLAERLDEVGVRHPTCVLVPVPLHPLRRLERGYDQARCLALAAADALGLECCAALRRLRWTPPQGASGAVSRSANVRAAFRVVERRAARLAGRTVFLVDDVVTSGATVESCASALRAATPAQVSVLCLARADPPDEEGPPGADTLAGTTPSPATP